MEPTIKQLRRLFLLLCLVVAGAQSAWGETAIWGERVYTVNVPIGGVTYECCRFYRAWLGGWGTMDPYSESFYASVISIEDNSSGSIEIPEYVTYEGQQYRVLYVGLHSYEELEKYSDGLHLYDVFKVKTTPVNISNNNIQNLTFKGEIEFRGDFACQSLTTLEFQKDVIIKSNVAVAGLRTLNLEGALTLEGTLISQFLEEIHFNKLTCTGKFQCSGLKDVYFLNTANVSFTGNWSHNFSNPTNSVTAHVYDKTPNQIAALHSTAVWCDFKEIVNHKTDITYNLVNNGNATVSFLRLEGNASYVSATSYSQYAQILSGSTSGTIKAGDNYAVEIRDVNFNAKDVTLKRNGVSRTLQTGEDQGDPVMYFEDLDLQSDVSYEVTVSDKQCRLNFTQTGDYAGKILYTKVTNGQSYNGTITGSTASVDCSQGYMLKLSIPYNQYTPATLLLDNSPVTITKENGVATATFRVPYNTSGEVILSWQKPQQSYEYHVPQITILRSGDGDVQFEGLNAQQDEWRVVKSADCVDDLTVVSVPDGDLNDNYDWGFRLIVTPVKGQTIRSLKMGHLDLDYDHYDEVEGYRTIMYWEDALVDDPLKLYCHYDQNTRKYTLEIEGEYDHGWGAGDFTLLVAMGPEESAVETGQKMSFVRKGGRGSSYIEWYDNSGRKFTFGEGSTSVLIPNEELQDNDLKMYVNTEEGETFRVYKDGMDITGLFELNGQSTTQYWALLEEESASYTLLIEEAPDANPVWKVLQHNDITGTQIVVSRSGQADETTNCSYAENELTIDDSNVTKVKLIVPAYSQEGCIPLRVLKNGTDVSYQYSDYDGEVLTYEVPVSSLYNTTWDISYITDLQQTFIVKGGTSENALEVEYEYLHSYPTLSVSSNDVPQSFYLPPFDNENNESISLTVNVTENEKATILRNGIDVTDAFDEVTGADGKCYKLDVSDAEFDGANTLMTLGFDIREAATWEITIEASATNVYAYVAGGTVSMKKILADNSMVTLGGGGSDCARTLNDGEGVQICFSPDVAGNELTMIKISNSELDIANDTRLVKEADGTYTFSLTSEELIALAGKNKEIQVFAEFDKSDSLKFDLNNDQKVDISDVTKLVNEILNKEQNNNDD